MRTISSTLLLSAALAAQNPCEGNGVGQAYLTTTPAIINGNLVMNMGSPASPNGIGLLLFGSGAGPTLPSCLDISQLFISLIGLLGPSGNAQFNLPIGAAPFGATLYSRALVLEGTSTWSESKTVRVSVEHADSTNPMPSMAQARSQHTLTAFEADPSDDRTGALAAGGALGSIIAPTALATTEVFSSLSRSWSAGPTLAVPRASHRAVRMQDGRILIVGGMTNAGAPATGGPATASCEIYSPATNTLGPAAPLSLARMGHAITLLPDGRVLVSGGLTDWTNAGPNFVARLNTGTDTTEIYDPTTNTWSAGPTMVSKRSGATQTLLADGRVLIAGGVNGGQSIPIFGQFANVPTFTGTCELFDPVTNTLTTTQPMPLAVGWHGASRLPDGTVLITGGAATIGANSEAQATNTCAVWSPATGTWATRTPLPVGVAFHTQVREPGSGSAWLLGGYTGNFANLQASSTIALHDGTTVTVQAPFYTNPGLPITASPTAAHAAAVLHDGTMLVTGGYYIALLPVDLALTALVIR